MRGHPLLGEVAVSRHERAFLRRMLACGPWCWPSAGDGARLDRALALAGALPAGELPVGVVPIVCVEGGRGSLFALELGGDEPDPRRDLVPLGKEARHAWDVARVALPRSLPVLWRSVHDAARRVPVARHVVTAAREGEAAAPADRVDGPSVGLAFFLSLASTVLGRPIPGDVIASAAIGEGGELAPVDGLREKIDVVARYAPRVCRFAVAAAQAAEAREAVAAAGDGTGLEVLAFRSAGEAVASLLPDLREMLASAGSGPDGRRRRRELVDSFFMLAACGRQGALDWTPVAEAASIAVERWRDLEDDERTRLEFARAVALRHQRNAGSLPVPSEAWLDRLPVPVRLSIVGHTVQQAADAGTPSWEEAAALAERFLVRGLEAFDPHLALLGAYGRLLAVAGQPVEALACQREAARGWVDRLRFEQVSYPLAEWLRLAGALEDGAAFAEGDDLLRELETFGRIDPIGSRYLALARARGLVSLGRGGEARRDLEVLAADLQAPDHVRRSASRWLIRVLDEAGGPGEEAAARYEALAALAASSDRQAADASVALALTDLDRALASGGYDSAGAKAAAAAAAALARLTGLQPGPLGHLGRAAGRCAFASERGLDVPRYVQRFFPY